jgi:exopolyphosphatase/guanosine-5'-triphosphate,3'-diphosphate pyrophosphatase
MVQLGRGSLQGKPLTYEAIERGTAALVRMAEIAKRDDVNEIVAVATSAVREAPNGKQFIKRAEEASGIRIRVISGEEEADFIYRAVRSSVDFRGGTALCVDIGGGSMELIVGTEKQVFFTRSEPLGVLRLSQQFLKSDPPSAAEIEALRKHVRRSLKKPVKNMRSIGWDFCIGTSGTINALADLAADTPPAGVEPAPAASLRKLSRNRLSELVKQLGELKASDRVTQLGVDPKRADSILAGAIALHELLELAGASSLRACDAALREGIVQRVLEEQSITKSTRESVRRSSVLDLMERSDVDRNHALQVARLALRIFDQTASLHRLKSLDRELLEDASLLHEIGMQISFDSYHKHTYYLVRHSGLRGFTDEQIAMLANVARFHRKREPADDDETLSELSSTKRATVRKLAAILRLADALDRSRRGAVRDVSVDLEKDQARKIIRPRQEANAEVETAQKRARFLGAMLDCKVRLVVHQEE